MSSPRGFEQNVYNTELSSYPLTSEIIKDASGQSDLESVEALEIVFEPLSDITALRHLCSLKQLTFIGNNLSALSFDFSRVSTSLQVLCIAKQNITKIENLHRLPNLRELYLYENKISRIENLNGCPNLQKLWLYSNKISVIENLDAMGDLRELWLQHNEIEEVQNLDSLVNLQVLNLSNNNIKEFYSLESLVRLPALFDLGLNDPHFGPCPVSNKEGYRDFVVFYLKQVRILDGDYIGDDERKKVEDTYLQTTIEFNDRIDDLKRETSEQVQLINEQIKGYKEKGDVMKDSFLSSLSALEDVVREGRVNVEKELKRQQDICSLSVDQFEEIVGRLRDEYEKEVESLVSSEKEKLQSEEKYHHALRKTGDFVRKQAEVLINVSGETNGLVVASELMNTSPEYRMLASLFDRSSTSKTRMPPFRIFKMFRVVNKRTSGGFAVNEESETEFRRVFMFQKADSIHSILKNGFHTPTDSDTLVFGCDPSGAVAEAATNAGGYMQLARGFLMLVCRLSGKVQEIATSSTSTVDYPSMFKSESDFDAFLVGKDSTSRAIVRNSSVVTPEIVIILTPSRMSFSSVDFDNVEGEITKSAMSVVSPIGVLSGQSVAKLSHLERSLENEFWMFLRQMWDELDPNTARVIREQEKEIHSLQSDLSHVVGAIEGEKLEQERVIREFCLAHAKEKMPQPPPRGRSQTPRRTTRVGSLK